MNDCEDHVAIRGSLFCPNCDKLVDPLALKTIDIRSFAGPQSLNPKVERFLETGDPSGM